MSLGNFKLKQQDTTIHLLEWHKPKTMAPPNAAGNADRNSLYCGEGGGVNGTATVDNSSAVAFFF